MFLLQLISRSLQLISVPDSNSWVNSVMFSMRPALITNSIKSGVFIQRVGFSTYRPSPQTWLFSNHELVKFAMAKYEFMVTYQTILLYILWVLEYLLGQYYEAPSWFSLTFIVILPLC